jgi:alpha-tubulin suppressor-like RCC1 family protein
MSGGRFRRFHVGGEVRGAVLAVIALFLVGCQESTSPRARLVFKDVGAGEGMQTCGVTADGFAYCWGYNGGGVLGTGTTAGEHECVINACATTPAAVAGKLAFAAVSAGRSHVCGLTTTGAAYCWGDNHNGQLGNGDTLAAAAPVPVTGGLTFMAISAGIDHTCGLTRSGVAYCWGNNHGGQLGNGSISYVNSTPVLVSGRVTFTAVGAGYEYACGLTAGGAAYCWGDNEYGELGTGDSTFSPVPVPVSGGLTFAALATGYFHVCGLTKSGVVYCWGGNFAGELGNDTVDHSTRPVAVSSGLTLASIGAGPWVTCGVTTAGAAYCWGSNGYGQLGSGAGAFTDAANPTPVPVSGGMVLASVSPGYLHTCGVTPEGAAYCWGDNTDGELGNGSTTISATPVPVAGP